MEYDDIKKLMEYNRHSTISNDRLMDIIKYGKNKYEPSHINTYDTWSIEDSVVKPTPIPRPKSTIVNKSIIRDLILISIKVNHEKKHSSFIFHPRSDPSRKVYLKAKFGEGIYKELSITDVYDLKGNFKVSHDKLRIDVLELHGVTHL